MPSGVTVRRMKMTTMIKTAGATRSKLVPALFAAVLGVALMALTGHVQAAALHDAAHDVRHATGFPCH
jgi:cobalt transporter subunit CbtB|tara:strand:+ start:316 stop:519 length:204 start_codon:yes stop_codon:yes gene_type:complete